MFKEWRFRVSGKDEIVAIVGVIRDYKAVKTEEAIAGDWPVVDKDLKEDSLQSKQMSKKFIVE